MPIQWTNEAGEEDLSHYYGFVYRIDYTDGTFYYGKKNFYTEVKTPLGKKELANQTDARLKKYKRIKRETNWRKYEGSNDATGHTISKKTILKCYSTARCLTYAEAELLFKRDVLFDDKCLNSNILGKFFGNVCGAE